MARIGEPYIVNKRGKSFQFTLNSTCGLPQRVCAEWQRKGFKAFPDELSIYRNPQTKPEAKANVRTLIAFLQKKQDEGSDMRVVSEDITVGAWIEKFTKIETSPRTGINATRNRPYSPNTVDTYRSYFVNHIQNDPFCLLKMAETEEEDALEFGTRLSLKKLESGEPMCGSRTYVAIIVFIRMVFESYKSKNRKWVNPFEYIAKPSYTGKIRDALPEDETLKLFMPGVLERTMELAVCAAIFLSGLRRSEVSALKPEDLDWHTPKITVSRAWQNFNKSRRVLGPPKGKKERIAPFDPVLQDAIKKLWEENGKHEFVFSWKNGEVIGPSWIIFNFKRWLKRAGIELNGRKIVPHSARHSLASILEDRGVSLRYIQDLLGHSDLKTTKIYLHSTEKTIRDIGQKIKEAREKAQTGQKEDEPNIVGFKVC